MAKTVLVIDDSGTIRKAIRRILEGMSYTVTEAEDGEQALPPVFYQCRFKTMAS